MTAFCLFAMLLARPSISHAGGGPENVILVVNPRSWASKTIANFYTHLRRIPDVCVIPLAWNEEPIKTDIETFRQKILQPILAEVSRRQLGPQMDYVVYSADFPYEIDFSSEVEEQDFASGSLTSMTYLAQLVMASEQLSTDHPVYTGLNVNWYASRRGDDLGEGPTRGFRAGYQWSRSGERVEQGGISYLLSTMLGYTHGPRANTVEEVVSYLTRSAMADGTHPKGTIYFMRNSDVRSTTRQANNGFAKAVEQLEELGVKAEIVDGTLPTSKLDVQGVMIGTATFRWETSGSRILPGAICEHLTSFGAVFARTARQTPLTELLRHGAAGASGTVIEPYAFQAKFPHPRIHVHYARGCSLAEAFYQSVYGPYQLLIVGDPLCRPWARIPQVFAEGIRPGAKLTGSVQVVPNAAVHRDQPIAAFHAFLDGRLVQAVPPGAALALETEEFSDGYHELRLVAIEGSDIQTQGTVIVPLYFANHQQQVECDIEPRKATYAWSDRIRIRAKMAGAEALELYHRRQRLDRAAGSEAVFEVDPSELGSGPVALQVAAIVDGNEDHPVMSAPLRLMIEFPLELGALAR